MDIGVGLLSTISGVKGPVITEWARRGEAAGFSSLATLDRIVYGNHDSIPTLAAAAAVTDRIRLTTSILIAPYRGNGALLAKQLATVDSLSAGRLTVGIAVGGREDDYTSTAGDFGTRGAAMDRLLAEMRAIWSGESRGTAGPIGPAPVQPGGPPLLIGGSSAAAMRRTVEYGAGWIAGGGGPDLFAAGAHQAREAWTQGGRAGVPRLAALSYYALGDDGKRAANDYLSDYYAFLGDYAGMIAAGALTDRDAILASIEGFEAAGCDELILFPCSPALEQVELLTNAIAWR